MQRTEGHPLWSPRNSARGRETRGAAGSGGFSVAHARVGGVPARVAIYLQHFLASAPQIRLRSPSTTPILQVRVKRARRVERNMANARATGTVDLTTQQVADLLGVDKTTVLRWLWRGELREPRFVRVGRIANRLWNAADLRRAREHMKRNYRKKNRA